MKRLIETQLAAWKIGKNRKPLLLGGARQVGKTYSLKQFGASHFPACHYFNFEQEIQLSKMFEKDLIPRRILDDLSLYSNTAIRADTDLVIFDEIQDCPKAITSLKYFCEDKPELALIAAGSLLGVRLSSFSFPVGKVELLDMHPMSFTEFLWGIGEDLSAGFLSSVKLGEEITAPIHSKLWRLLKTYFVTGGLPEVIQLYRDMRDQGADLFETLQLVRKKQQDLILTYLADMAKHSGKLNSMHIDRLWRNVPSQLSRTQDGSASKYQFKGVLPGINRYERLAGPIDWLTTAGLLIKVPILRTCALPLLAHTKDNVFKLYFFDVGILGAMGQMSPKVIMDYDYGTYKGYFAENFVAQEFLSSGEKTLYGWNEGNAEVEFLREVEGKILPTEVKSGWSKQSKSLKVFSDKYHPEYLIMISANPPHVSGRLHKYPLYLASRIPF